MGGSRPEAPPPTQAGPVARRAFPVVRIHHTFATMPRRAGFRLPGLSDLGGLTKKLITLIAGLALIVAACSSDGEASCADIADEGIQLIQDFVDEVSELSLEEIVGSGDDVPGLTDFEEEGERLQDKANDAGCSDEEMESLLNQRAGDLESDSEFGQLIIDSIRSEGLFSE